jgi:hypothetical protein
MTNNDSIVFALDDDDDKSWCSDCEALLYERRDGSMIYAAMEATPASTAQTA